MVGNRGTVDYQRFLKCAEVVLSVEGGYSNDFLDPGGPTMRGVAWNYNKEILQSLGYSKGTIRSLTRDHALEIYYQKYWDTTIVPTLNDIRLQLVAFDAVVNQGPYAAAMHILDLSKNPRHYEGRGKNSDLFLLLSLELLTARLKKYTKFKNWGRYGVGWVNRLAHLFNTIIRWTSAGDHLKI